MIQFTESLADAYVRPARNVAMPSTPGRQVKFLQGHATIKDGRDLAAMLRRPDVQIMVTTYGLNWIEEIEKAAGQVRADVRKPVAEVRTPVAEPEEPAEARTPADGGWPRDPVTHRFLKRKLVEGEPE